MMKPRSSEATLGPDTSSLSRDASSASDSSRTLTPINMSSGSESSSRSPVAVDVVPPALLEDSENASKQRKRRSRRPLSTADIAVGKIAEAKVTPTVPGRLRRAERISRTLESQHELGEPDDEGRSSPTVPPPAEFRTGESVLFLPNTSTESDRIGEPMPPPPTSPSPSPPPTPLSPSKPPKLSFTHRTGSMATQSFEKYDVPTSSKPISPPSSPSSKSKLRQLPATIDPPTTTAPGPYVPPRQRRAFSSEFDPASPTTTSSNTAAAVTRAFKLTGTGFINPEVPGYVGFANLPNQVHRKSVKKGFEFTLMVVGESGLGKSTLINSLFLTDLYPERATPSTTERLDKTVKIEASSVEIEERGVKLRLTVVDTPGFADALNHEDSFKAIISYIDQQFERYLQDESGLNRRNIVDNRVHCCFYFINPAGHGLKPLDISFMKTIHHKVNIVPVIAKADTLTKSEVGLLKQKILQQIEKNQIQLYTLPDCDSDEDEEYKEQCNQLKKAVPFAVVGSNTVIEVRGKKVRGRMYPWGVVEVENPEHCDFIKLRTMLITHMQDLQEVTQEVHYENFRSASIACSGASLERKGHASKTPRKNDPEKAEKLTEKEKALEQKEAELRHMQEMLSKMQAEMQLQQRGASQRPVSAAPLPPGKANGHHINGVSNGH